MAGESGVRRLRGGKATKMDEKAKSVARGGEKRRLRGEKSNKNGRKGKKCCQRW